MKNTGRLYAASHSNLLGHRQVSRRAFLRQLGCLSSVFVSGLSSAATLQKSSGPYANSNRATHAGRPSGFYFSDVTAQAGLSAATNVFGGVTHKRYILEEI